jgi:hypothetical protein
MVVESPQLYGVVRSGEDLQRTARLRALGFSESRQGRPSFLKLLKPYAFKAYLSATSAK